VGENGIQPGNLRGGGMMMLLANMLTNCTMMARRLLEIISIITRCGLLSSVEIRFVVGGYSRFVDLLQDSSGSAT
jgi:hypothetical protein